MQLEEGFPQSLIVILIIRLRTLRPVITNNTTTPVLPRLLHEVSRA